MTLSAGRLRHRISLQEPQTIRDPVTGDVLLSWVEVVKLWAAIEPLSVREFLAADAEQSKVTARIIIRYRPGIDQSMRIVHRGEVYNIEGALPDKDSGIEYLTIPASRGVNDG